MICEEKWTGNEIVLTETNIPMPGQQAIHGVYGKLSWT